jgi:uncharacterized coiled-coil DUF342 family protein
MDMMEKNLVASFRNVKDDVMDLKDQITELNKAQKQLMGIISKLKDKDNALSTKVEKLKNGKPKVRTVTKTVVKRINGGRKHQTFVASKSGNRVHIEACPFAKNIKPKSKVTFASKVKAFNSGYKACECLKKI